MKSTYQEPDLSGLWLHAIQVYQDLSNNAIELFYLFIQHGCVNLVLVVV